MKDTKVIGVGFHKTGTSTLRMVLAHFGYTVSDIRHDLVPFLEREDLDSIRKIADSFDAYEDNPWPLLYQELDQWYPGSKFILTLRDDEKWINSVTNHFGGVDKPMRRWIYGVGDPRGNESLYLDRYKRHNEEVQAYFADRPGDLLEVNWEHGDGWERICEFLGESIPDIPFPHANKGSYSPFKPVRKAYQYYSRRLMKMITGNS